MPVNVGLRRLLSRRDELSHFFDRRKQVVALAGVAGLTTKDERRFGAHQQLLFAFRNEVILCGPGSVVIPLDHSEAVSAGIRITEAQGLAGSPHYSERRPGASFFFVWFGACSD